MTKLVKRPNQALSRVEFEALSDVPPETEWLNNIESKQTRRAYKNDISEFFAYSGIQSSNDIRLVTRAHVIAWRDHLNSKKLATRTIRRKLSALASLYDYFCEKNAVTHNPVNGVERPKAGNVMETPGLSDEQARALLASPDARTLKGKRDKAILATLLYHGLRRAELCQLRVRDMRQDRGFMYFYVKGKGKKTRPVEINPLTIRLIDSYLKAAGHANDLDGALFRPMDSKRKTCLDKHLNSNSVYRHIVRYYGEKTGINADVVGFTVHSLRATAATNALIHGADITEVQQWLGHSDISTTRIYDKRKHAPEKSPSFKIKY